MSGMRISSGVSLIEASYGRERRPIKRRGDPSGLDIGCGGVIRCSKFVTIITDGVGVIPVVIDRLRKTLPLERHAFVDKVRLC